MFRRLATLACALALLAALVVAGLHDHAAGAAAHAGDGSACLYCAGGMTAADGPALAPIVERLWLAPEPSAPAAPSLRRTQPLDHSGNAPPA